MTYSISLGDSVRVADKNGGEWPGEVTVVFGREPVVEVAYAGYVDQFRAGRCGSRYLVTEHA